MKTCPRCHKQRPDDEVVHTCVAATTRPDHEAAASWAERLPKQATVSMDDENLSRAYLDAMARLDKATELLRAALGRSECYDEDHECGETDTTRAIRAFLDERK